MVDKKDSLETIITNKKKLPTLNVGVMNVKEMGVVANTIEDSFKDVADFPEIMKTEMTFAQKIIEGIKSGEINDETAAKIIAISRAELVMITETDPLTELPNRLKIEKIMRVQVSLAKRNGTPISIAFLDLDKFKEINDKYGHDAGDASLYGLGSYLKSELKRPTDEAGRWGGEEFILVLPDANEEGASHVLNNIRQGLNESVSEAVFNTCGYKFDRDITASIGFTTVIIDKNDIRTPEEIVKELVNVADKRMLLAKNNGRNRVVGSIQEKELLHQAS